MTILQIKKLLHHSQGYSHLHLYRITGSPTSVTVVWTATGLWGGLHRPGAGGCPPQAAEGGRWVRLQRRRNTGEKRWCHGSASVWKPAGSSRRSSLSRRLLVSSQTNGKFSPVTGAHQQRALWSCVLQPFTRSHFLGGGGLLALTLKQRWDAPPMFTLAIMQL